MFYGIEEVFIPYSFTGAILKRRKLFSVLSILESGRVIQSID
jgi:hypothetical protein